MQKPFDNAIIRFAGSPVKTTTNKLEEPKMQPVKLQTALSELGQVDTLLEMILSHLVNVPIDTHDRPWFEKLEHALHLLEETYKTKKAGLISALEGGESGE